MSNFRYNQVSYIRGNGIENSKIKFYIKNQLIFIVEVSFSVIEDLVFLHQKINKESDLEKQKELFKEYNRLFELGKQYCNNKN